MNSFVRKIRTHPAAGRVRRSISRFIGGSTVVLCYHRIIDDSTDTSQLCVSPSNFERQMTCLRRAAEVVPLKNVLVPSRDVRVAVTFDDGYADNCWNALAILEEHQVPATVFVTSGWVGSDSETWWDRLESMVILGQPNEPVFELETESDPLMIDCRSEESRRSTYRSVHTYLRDLPPGEINNALDRWMNRFALSGRTRPTHRMLDVQELKKLAASKLVTIGSHSVSHPLLKKLPKQVQRREIFESKARLEAQVGKVGQFAYPYGGIDSFSWTSASLVKEAGYDLACANFPGNVDRFSRRFAIPRHLVRNWGEDEFRTRLNYWLSPAP